MWQLRNVLEHTAKGGIGGRPVEQALPGLPAHEHQVLGLAGAHGVAAEPGEVAGEVPGHAAVARDAALGVHRDDQVEAAE